MADILIGFGIYQTTLVVGMKVQIVGTIVGTITTQYGYDVTIQTLTGEQFVCHSYNIAEYLADANRVLLPGACTAINGSMVSINLPGISPDVVVGSFSLNGGSVPGGPGRFFLW